MKLLPKSSPQSAHPEQISSEERAERCVEWVDKIQNSSTRISTHFVHSITRSERADRALCDLYTIRFMQQGQLNVRISLTFSFYSGLYCLLEKVDNRIILSGMGELLTEKQKDWVRKNLKKELLFQLKLSQELHKNVI